MLCGNLPPRLAGEVVSPSRNLFLISCPDPKRDDFWERGLNHAVCLWTELCLLLRDPEGFKEETLGKGCEGCCFVPSSPGERIGLLVQGSVMSGVCRLWRWS